MIDVFENALVYYLEIEGNIEHLEKLCCKLLNKCFEDTKKYMKEKDLKHMSINEYATIRNHVLYDDPPDNIFEEISEYECTVFRICETEVRNIRKNIKNIDNDMHEDEKMLYIIDHLDVVREYVMTDIRQLLMNRNITHYNDRLNDEHYPRMLYNTVRLFDERLYHKMCFINKLQQIQQRNAI